MRHELKLSRWLQEYIPGISIINIFSDNKYNHISSSAIRELLEYKNLADGAKKYIVS